MKIRRLEVHVNEGPEAVARIDVEFPTAQEALDFIDAFRAHAKETGSEPCQSDSPKQ